MLRYKIALLGFSMLITFFAAELWLRAVDAMHVPPVVGERREDGLFTFTPNLSVDYYSGEAGRFTKFQTDALGFVGKQNSAPKEGTPLIAFIGDSFTEANQVDTEKNFVSLLQKRFSDKPVSFINDGRGGEGTVQEIARYAAHVEKLKPATVVLVMYLGNDFEDNAAFMAHKDTLLAAPIEKWPHVPAPVLFATGSSMSSSNTSFIRSLLLQSRLIVFLREVARNDPRIASMLVKVGVFKDLAKVDLSLGQILPYVDPNSDEGKKGLDFTADVVKKLQTTVSKNGGRLLVVLIPAHWQVSPHFIAQLKERLPQAQEDLPQKVLSEKLGKKVPILDLSGPIKKAQGEGKQVYFLGRGHFTEYGHELAADEIARFLEDNVPALK